MYALPCNHCDEVISVTPARAGDDLQCPHCDQTVKVPTLGKIRQLPTIGGVDVQDPVSDEPSRNGLPFAVCGGLATLALIIAGFCCIRYSLIEVPNTTQEHIDKMIETYQTASAAELIREYEDMEEYALELSTPYRYKNIELDKRRWGRNSIAALVASGLLILASVVLGLRGRKPKQNA